MTVTLEQLRAEHQAQFIGPELLKLLERVASATARTYPPSYSDAGVWNDEAIADVLHDWIADRLLGRRDLTKLLAGARSVSSLRSGLTRSLRQLLTNRRERDSATNLYTRTVKLLRADPFFERVGYSSKPHEQLWGLSAQEPTGPSTATLKRRLEVAAELSDDELGVVRYGPFAAKSSPVLREPALKRFVCHLLANLGALTPADILEIMRRRFALAEPEQLELTADMTTHDAQPHDEAIRRVIARSILARTSEADAALLAALNVTEDVAKAAKVAGCSAADVQHALDRLLYKVAMEAVDEDDAENISGKVIESLFKPDR
jgi:hypothetical protein